jgi:hypothetical protein
MVFTVREISKGWIKTIEIPNVSDCPTHKYVLTPLWDYDSWTANKLPGAQAFLNGTLRASIAHTKALPRDGRSVKSVVFVGAGIALPVSKINPFDVFNVAFPARPRFVKRSKYAEHCRIAAWFSHYLLPDPALYHLGIQFAPEGVPDGGIIIIPRGRKPQNRENIKRLSTDRCFFTANRRFTKGAIMNLQDVCNLLNAEILVGGGQMHAELTTAFAADTMSDLLAFGKAGGLLLTRMTSPQVIRTSDIMDIAAIIMIRGKVPSKEVIELADELHVPILATRLPQFEAAGLLYAKGLRGT